jgi:heme-degrading monooxygenase HmoA
MIVRIWHGTTPRARADAYAEFLKERSISDHRDAFGNQEVIILRRDEQDVSHFLTVSRWESEGAVRDWAGGDLLRTKYYSEDKDFLLELEPEVQHFTVVGLAP